MTARGVNLWGADVMMSDKGGSSTNQKLLHHILYMMIQPMRFLRSVHVNLTNVMVVRHSLEPCS